MAERSNAEEESISARLTNRDDVRLTNREDVRLINREDVRLINRDDVRHIAYLIRLALTDEEVEVFSEQLSTIVDYFDRLAEVNVEGVPPYRQPQMPREGLREDVVQPSMPQEDLLANAPQHQDGLVRVPVVLDTPKRDEG